MILTLSRLDGTCLVLNQARDGKGELVWARPLGDWGEEARARGLAGQAGQIRSRPLDRGDRGPRKAALSWMSRSCKLAAWHQSGSGTSLISVALAI